MSLSALEYYKALNGESLLDKGVWHIDFDKRHAFSVSSDLELANPSLEQLSLPPSDTSTDIISRFSDQLNQKINNTRIVASSSGEKIELELNDRIVTIILDQSGSMTWNDSGNFRHSIAKDLINKIDNSYPGDVYYNVLEYGAEFINVLFFGLIEEDGVNPYDIDTLSSMFYADEEADYAGIRVVRKEGDYPTAYAGIDGEIVEEGFISRILDSNLIPDKTYYYGVYTYDNNLKFSDGLKIKVAPRARIVPRGVSVFKTFVESTEVSKGEAFKGSGVNRDGGTIGLWHMDEGRGRYLYDFSNNGKILTIYNDDPEWYDSRYVPSGTSGLFFNGEDDLVNTTDADNDLAILFSGSDNVISIGLWVYPYDIESPIFVSRDNGSEYNYVFATDTTGKFACTLATNQSAVCSTLTLERNKWQYIAMVSDGTNVAFYKNGQTETVVINGVASYDTSSSYNITLGNGGVTDLPFRGRMTEVSIHNVERSAAYFATQIISKPVYDASGTQVDTEYIGIKDDNGDRLVVFEYEVSDDYNFSGGQVSIVKKPHRFNILDGEDSDIDVRIKKYAPSWEEDGTIIHSVAAAEGKYFVLDTDDFTLGEKYYYRIFSENLQGNTSFLSDSPALEVEIPTSDTDEYFVSPISTLASPVEPSDGQLVTPGNKKVYLRWGQNVPLDANISRVKIYYSSLNYPNVNNNGGHDGTLVYSGFVEDEKFVHRGLANGVSAYYTIVNVDKYGRSSNYDTDGIQEVDFLHALTVPLSSADESTIPLSEVDNLYYELIDDSKVSIGWRQPSKSAKDVDAYFDQTVLLYSSITDEFGAAISKDTSIKMYVDATINKDIPVNDVFTNTPPATFDNIDAYDFFVSRTDEGFMKATLRMTRDSSIISQIKEATFKIQLKAYIPRNGYSAPNTVSAVNESLEEYATTVSELAGVTEVESSSSSGDNIFEYFSEPITVKFTNPWKIELVSRDNQTVYQQCYIDKKDEFGIITLGNPREIFHGVHMKSSAPFVARAKVTYKGEPVESGNLQLAVWDANSDNLCAGAADDSAWGFEGEAYQPSQTILPPDGTMELLQGTESLPGSIDVAISYVDIPLYSPDMPQAVRLFVKGEKSGYSSIKDIYILFQNIMRIDFAAQAPAINGRDIAEQIAKIYIINPDYPGDDDYSRSLRTYPSDLSAVSWRSRLIKGDIIRGIYSTDGVPITNGIWSYTRSGVARNVFMGPIARGKFEEVHEISVNIVYEGLTAEAKDFIYLDDDPNNLDVFGARFLMEIGDGPGTDGRLASGSWLSADGNGNALWTDGGHYKKIKIHRDPLNATFPAFRAAECFSTCASQDDSQLFELNSGQVVNVTMGNDDIEIVHGEIYEVIDPYTGEYSLRIGEDGYADKGSAFIELENEEDTDVTTFYIRVNRFVPGAGLVRNPECDMEKDINNCTCLGATDTNSNVPLNECDLPQWNPVIYASGTTTIFVNDQPLVLSGGGDFNTGIPPCPICLLEPLAMEVLWKRVTNYFYSKTLGDPINGFIYPITVDSLNDDFKDINGDTLIRYDSDINIRIKVSWKSEFVPDETPVFIAIGDKTGNTAFIASRNVYYTQTDDAGGYSYVDVAVSPRKIVSETVIEDLEIYCIYDENGKTDRHLSVEFKLTLDVKDDDTIPVLPELENPSIEKVEEPITPFSNKVYRYSEIGNEWNELSPMNDSRGNSFYGIVGNNIYVMGGLKDNSFTISDSNEIYDISNNSWSNGVIMPKSRFAGMSVTIGEYIYLIGGISHEPGIGGGLSVSTRLEKYRTDTDTWEILADMPIIGTLMEERLGVAFGTAQHVQIEGRNYIYVMGGMQDVVINDTQFYVSKYNDRILRYSVEDNEWSNSGVLRTNEMETYPRVSPLSMVYDNKIVVFGGAMDNSSRGEGDFSYALDNFYIDIEKDFTVPDSGFWLNFGSGFMSGFPVPKIQAAMAEYNSNPSTDEAKYYIIGGSNEDSQNLDLVESIDTGGTLFVYQNSLNFNPSAGLAPLPIGKHGVVAVASTFQGTPHVYVIGGYTEARDNTFVDINFDI